MLRGSHHILPVMSFSLVTIFRFIFLSLSFLCMRIVARQNRSWDNLIVLEDCTCLMWRHWTLDFDFDIASIEVCQFLRTR